MLELCELGSLLSIFLSLERSLCALSGAFSLSFCSLLRPLLLSICSCSPRSLGTIVFTLVTPLTR